MLLERPVENGGQLRVLLRPHFENGVQSIRCNSDQVSNKTRSASHEISIKWNLLRLASTWSKHQLSGGAFLYPLGHLDKASMHLINQCVHHLMASDLAWSWNRANLRRICMTSTISTLPDTEDDFGLSRGDSDWSKNCQETSSSLDWRYSNTLALLRSSLSTCASSET